MEEFIVSTLSQQDPTLVDLVEECISELPNLASQLREALQQNDFEKAARIAHNIKGAGGSYGFEPVALKAASLEQLCLKGDLKSAEQELQELLSLLPRLRAKP